MILWGWDFLLLQEMLQFPTSPQLGSLTKNLHCLLNSCIETFCGVTQPHVNGRKSKSSIQMPWGAARPGPLNNCLCWLPSARPALLGASCHCCRHCQLCSAPTPRAPGGTKAQQLLQHSLPCCCTCSGSEQRIKSCVSPCKHQGCMDKML